MATNFNDTTPAAPSGSVNVKWQNDSSGNASAYVAAGGGTVVTLVPPIPASYTQVNAGTATYANTAKVMSILCPLTTGDNLRLNVKTAPAVGGTGIWQVSVGFTDAGWNQNYNRACICFRESATSKILSCGSQGSSAYTVARHNSPTSFSGTPYQNGSHMPGVIYWIRMKYDGTNCYFLISPDGVNWNSLYSESKTAFFTTAPDQAGFLADTNNGSTPYVGWISVFHWLEESL